MEKWSYCFSSSQKGRVCLILLLDGIHVYRSALTLKADGPDRSAKGCCFPPTTRCESQRCTCNKLPPNLKRAAGFKTAPLGAASLQKRGPSEAGDSHCWMGSLCCSTRFHCPNHVLVFAISHALLWKTICKISKGKCNPWVEWKVLWNEWGIILLLSVTNALYFCIIWAWE